VIAALCVAGVCGDPEGVSAATPAESAGKSPKDAKSPSWVATADAQWRPVDLKQTKVQPGSALDFSRLVPAKGPGRLTIGADGSLRDDADNPVRLWGASVTLNLLAKRFALGRSAEFPWPRDAEVAAFAEEVRIQGYNWVRLGGTDMVLTTNAEKTGEFDPRAVELIDCFVSHLRRRGICVYLDLMGSLSGYTAGNPWLPEAKALNFKRTIFTNPEVRQNWVDGVRKYLSHRNPYTGYSLAEDPMVVAVLPFNEQDIPLRNAEELSKLPAAWAQPWRDWLTRVYAGDPSALAKAWGVPVDDPNEIALPTLDQLRSGRRAEDAVGFLRDAHMELLDFYRQNISALGCTAPLTQFDGIPSLFFTALRGECPVISMHAYHAHPSKWALSGSKIDQSSAISGLLPNLRLMASTRQFAKPFLVTEYGQAFWNRFRHEEGLTTGAFAAHQGWNALMAHQLPIGDLASPAYAYADGSVDRPSMRSEHPLDKAPIKPFWIAADPVARASQVISTLAYADAAVATSSHRVEVVIPPAATVAPASWSAGLPGDQRSLALISELGVRVGTIAPTPGIALQVPLSGTTLIVATEAAAGMGDDPGNQGQVIAHMRKTGLIPDANQTDKAKGIYESDTGELRIDRARLLYTVRTPRLEGATLGKETAAELGALNVHRVSVPGSVAAASLDGKSLGESRRILLVYATDALNSGMTFTGPDRVELVDIGHAPVLIKAGTLSASIRTAQAAELHAWVLGFDGARRQELPLTRTEDSVRLDVDMASLPEPSFFIELAVP
jgi:hypothetical protein